MLVAVMGRAKFGKEPLIDFKIIRFFQGIAEMLTFSLLMR
jgi:hypothetical protein